MKTFYFSDLLKQTLLLNKQTFDMDRAAFIKHAGFENATMEEQAHLTLIFNALVKNDTQQLTLLINLMHP